MGKKHVWIHQLVYIVYIVYINVTNPKSFTVDETKNPIPKKRLGIPPRMITGSTFTSFVVQLRGFKSEVYTLWLEVVKTQESLRFFHQGLERQRLRNCVNSAPCFEKLLAAPLTRDLNRDLGWRTAIFSFCAEQILLVCLQMSNKQQIATSLHPYTQHGRGETHGDEPPAGCLALATKVTFYWNWCSAIYAARFN